MAMSDFNMQNPYVYMLFTSSRELDIETTQTVKSFVTTVILQSLTIVLLTILMVVTRKVSYIPLIIITLVYTGFAFIQMRRAIQVNQKNAIVEMINGDDYSSVNVNSEELLDGINSSFEAIGRIRFSKEMINIHNLIMGVGCSIVFVILLSYLFK